MFAQTPADEGSRRVDRMLGGRFEDHRLEALALGEALVDRVSSITHLSWYSTGACDFALDVTNGDDPPGLTAEERQIIGRDAVHVMTDLDRYLRAARTGDLIRMLLHTERGGLFALSVLREQFLVAFGGTGGDAGTRASRDPAVHTIDAELSRLANRLRETVNQGPADYGGWLGPSGPDLRAGLRDSRPTPPPPDAVAAAEVGFQAAVPGTRAATTAAVCRRYLDVDDLHYAAVCHAGRVEATADILDDPRLARLFDGITPERRRHFYAWLGQRIDSYVRILVRAAHLALGSRVRRLVLDVEQGALYCYPVGRDRYLLGVTVDQQRMWAADDKAALLARQLGG
ncbi:hypothetical protein O7606_13935 [Micromonospora sp. WMMD882]|uniref:hypothetical protein n=1 Tax=Micromonospora sp. WMMD882 TaxID=3015151 RepID=UPI00248AC35B|nr:hypothetical protein [Micromonospora sp. WMMD882]WBB77394.1 hypothetical protein O7606_13935 [Micromonospora sp. WMMD882]